MVKVRASFFLNFKQLIVYGSSCTTPWVHDWSALGTVYDNIKLFEITANFSLSLPDPNPLKPTINLSYPSHPSYSDLKPIFSILMNHLGP